MYFFTLSAGEKWTHFLEKSVTTSICFSGLLKIVYTFFCIKQVNEFFFLINVQWTKGRNQYTVEKGLTLVQFNFRSLFVVKNITLLKLKHTMNCVYLFFPHWFQFCFLTLIKMFLCTTVPRLVRKSFTSSHHNVNFDLFQSTYTENDTFVSVSWCILRPYVGHT